jgi:succinoglycan biosynthesis protein ExoL
LTSDVQEIGLAGAAAGSLAPAAQPRQTIAFFAHDSLESTVIKRTRSFQAHGAHVVGFMFRREREGRQSAPEWENIDLGATVDRNYLARLPRLLLGIVKAASHARLLRRCDAIYARNIDMLLVAVLTKALTGAKAPVVYEVLDVRRIFLGAGLASRFFRWAERGLMRSARLLVVSAPDYISEYFEPAHGFRGRWFLLENKLPKQAVLSGALQPRPPRPPGPPWVIGMFGVLKCARSFDILCRLAERLGDSVSIYLRGTLSETDISPDMMRDACRRHPNVIYDGPYSNPKDLPDIYGRVHFIWAADFLDPGGNSEWCLANRLYEGGLMGAVMLAGRGNATGRMVEREGLGFTLAEPLEEEAASFLRKLTPEDYLAARARVKAAERSLFVDETDTARLMEIMRDLGPRGGRG